MNATKTPMAAMITQPAKILKVLTNVCVTKVLQEMASTVLVSLCLFVCCKLALASSSWNLLKNLASVMSGGIFG